jgi:hypothetical protein
MSLYYNWFEPETALEAPAFAGVTMMASLANKS